MSVFLRRMRDVWHMAGLCFCFFSLGLVGKDLAWDPDAVLERAGQNRFEISQALDRIPASQRAGLRFLPTHMPESDLQSLSWFLFVMWIMPTARGRNRHGKAKFQSNFFSTRFFPTQASMNEGCMETLLL